MAECLGQKLQAFNTGAREVGFYIDSSIGVRKFVRSHAGVSHNDQTGLGVSANEIINLFRFELPLRIGPDAAVNGVVKKVNLQILELGTGVVKKSLNDIDVRIHGPAAVINQEYNLQTVRQTAIEDDFDFPGIAHGFINGFIDVHNIPGTRRRHAPQSFQGLAHLKLGQGTFLGVITVTPFHSDLDG